MSGDGEKDDILQGLTPEEQQEFDAAFDATDDDDAAATAAAAAADTKDPPEGGEGDGAGAGDDDTGGEDDADKDDPPPSGEDGAGEGGGEPDKDAGEQDDQDGQPEWLSNFQAGLEKSNRDTMAMFGRLQQRLDRIEQGRGGGGGQQRQQQQQAGGGGGQGRASFQFSDAFKTERLAKLREYDPELADAVESMQAEIDRGFGELDSRIGRVSEQSRTEMQTESERRTLREAFPGQDPHAWLVMDEGGNFTNPEFVQYLNQLPYAQAQELLNTEDTGKFIDGLRLFAETQSGGSPPGKKPGAGDAGGGEDENNPKDAARQARRSAQRRSATGVRSRQGGEGPHHDDEDSFDAGWNAVEREEARRDEERRRMMSGRRAA